jgi:alpha-L-arabinofuranosidase
VTSLSSAIVLDAQTLSDTDVYAKNTLEHPERVGLMRNKSVSVRDGIVTITLPPVSWTALNLG